jgi:hypothetical protein
MAIPPVHFDEPSEHREPADALQIKANAGDQDILAAIGAAINRACCGRWCSAQGHPKMVRIPFRSAWADGADCQNAAPDHFFLRTAIESAL